MDHVLVLIRHAKAASSWAGGSEDDAERPLAPRGRRDAPAAGRWLSGRGVMPDQVVVSPARRARQTWALIAPALGSEPTEPTEPTVHTDPRVYENTVDALLAVVRETPDTVRTLVLVGHNPSVQELTSVLDDGDGDPEAREVIARGFPTNGLAVFGLTGSWADLVPGGAALRGFASPRG